MFWLIFSKDIFNFVLFLYFSFPLFLLNPFHLIKVLLCVLQLRLLLMSASIVFVLYLLSNFICHFNQLLFLFFIIIRSLFLKRQYLMLLEHLLTPLTYLSLCHNELGKLLPLTTSLLCLEIVEFVVTGETVNQAMPAFSLRGHQLLLLELTRMWLWIRNSLDVCLNDPLHLTLPSFETLFDVVFLEKVHKGLIDLVPADLG